MMLLLACAAGALAEKAVSVKMHLPRSVVVNGKTIRLGDLGVIRSSDTALAAKASDIAMGRRPWSGEKIVVDRRTILSRLAANGISASAVSFTGSENVSVTRGEKVFESRVLSRIAEAFINKTRPLDGQCKWRLLRKPEDLLAPGDGDVRLQPRLGSELSGGCLSVEIVALRGNRQVGLARVLFKQLYSMRKLVAARDIPAGGVITPQNTRIEVVSVLRQAPRWISPYGMTCSRAVRAGAVVARSLWTTRKTTVVVRRRKSVRMKIQMAGFAIVAAGQALEDGRVGETIKVRNADSKRIVLARVNSDGTVSPVYNTRGGK